MSVKLLPALLPEIALVTDLLAIIITLCDNVPQNKSAVRQLANRCKIMYQVLEQCENADIPERTDKYCDAVFRCLENVRLKMTTWAKKSQVYMVLHQNEFETNINDCNANISDCLNILLGLRPLESQQEDENWERNLQERLDDDCRAFRKLLSSMTFVQHATASTLMQNQNIMKKLLDMMQRGLAEGADSKEDHDHMASNLYDLLRLSNQLPPQCQLDSGEVEWTNRVPVGASKNVDIYKGRYLKREDVTIKVIRTVRKDEESINRVKREIGLRAKMHDIDKGRHFVPLYGFCTANGVHLALVSPWIPYGEALAYIKKHDQLVDYRKLIRGIAEGIGVLHSMVPPIIYGKLKATKILIGDEGQPLLTDFAFAELEDGSILGSPDVSEFRWSAPEICSDTSTVSTKSDIYSFGMTILELLTHEEPNANIALRIIDKVDRGILPDRPNSPRVIERGLDDGMWELLIACWSFDIEKRPSIDSILVKLSELQDFDMNFGCVLFGSGIVVGILMAVLAHQR